MVELIGRYSNPFEQGGRLRDLMEMVPRGSPEASAGPRKQVHRRLRPAEIEELVAGYQAGTTACQLADRFRIHRATVLSLLERRSVARRDRRLSSTQVDQARELYAAGQSLAKVGKRLGCHASTVRLALPKAGVRMRDCQGRELWPEARLHNEG